MDFPDKLITAYNFELVEDHHSPGSGRYGVKVTLPIDISAVFPYLNSVLDDSRYDHENHILIGTNSKHRYAFRPHEIQAGIVANLSEASSAAEVVVELVNRIWHEREHITPSLRERKLPAVYDIYRLLPRTNCKKCGYMTCLACAADISNGVISPDKCSLLLKPEYSQKRLQILEFLSSK
jgi:ArsR family metal-binding transcriptional regulator